MYHKGPKMISCLPVGVRSIGLFLCLLFLVSLAACSTPLTKERISTEVDEKPLEKLLQEGTEAYSRSDYRNALISWNKGLRLAKSEGKRRYEGSFMYFIGFMHCSLDQYDKALIFSKQALAISREIGDRSGEGKALNSIGNVYVGLGQYDKAQTSYEQALAIAREIGDRFYEGAALNSIGIVYRYLGQYDIARTSSWQAILIFREIGGRFCEEAALTNLGIVYRNLGQYDKALIFHEQGLAISREIGDRFGEGSALANIGIVYKNLGQYDKALTYCEQALAISREIGDRSIEGGALNNIGIVYEHLGQYEEALTYYEQALRITNEVGEPETLWRVFYGLQQSHKGLDNPLTAIFFGKLSVNTLQSIRTHIGGMESSLQQSFMEDKRFVYEQLADLLIDEGRLAEAQQVLAMLKEEEYFDFIRRRSDNDPRGTQVSYTQLEKPWRLRYAEISKQLVGIAREHSELKGKQKLGLTAEEEVRLVELKEDLKAANKAFNMYLVELKKAFEENERKEPGVFPEKELEGLRAFQSTLEQLGKGTVAIHYLSTGERLSIMVTGSIKSQPPLARDAKIGEKDLNRLIFSYRETLQHPWKDALPQAQQLYKFIFKPIEDDLEKMGVRTLLVYLDGALRYLPLSALHDGKRYVAEHYAMVMYTAVAKDKLKDLPIGAWQAACLGVSEAVAGFSALTAVPEELDGIVKESAQDPIGVLPGRIHLDKEFTRENLSAVLWEGYPVVHVASHFRFEPGTDMDSFLLLGAGERLNLADFQSEAAEYPLGKVDLLTLSACETGFGGGVKEDGSEVEGFGALAQQQGAKAVLATLWKVADRSTGQFMQLLYRFREEKKLTKAEALRRVQEMFIRGEVQVTAAKQKLEHRTAWPVDKAEGEFEFDPKAPYAHPYYWAPFILMGNFL
jgi:CHAT domain-containing protein/tetratricopeptide (TPR) repeat protein